MGIVLGLLILPLGAWLMKLILKLFKKRLTVKKLMNIYGYALVPRLVIAIIGTVLFIIFPQEILQPDGLTGLQLGLIISGIAALIYTLFLYFYGIAVSPSEPES